MTTALVIGTILVLAFGGYLFIFCAGELGDRYDGIGRERERVRNRPNRAP